MGFLFFLGTKYTYATSDQALARHVPIPLVPRSVLILSFVSTMALYEIVPWCDGGHGRATLLCTLDSDVDERKRKRLC